MARELSEETAQNLALYALDALDDPAARQEVEGLIEQDPVCRQEFDDLRASLGLLPFSLQPKTPPDSVKDRLMQRVRQDSPGVSRPASMPLQLDFDSLQWEATGQPGVDRHLLRHDESSHTSVYLARLAPGASFPDHRHPGGEDCFVLRGRIRDSRGEFGPGDFMYYGPGTVHSDLMATGEDPCILFVVSHGGIQILPESNPE